MSYDFTIQTTFLFVESDAYFAAFIFLSKFSSFAPLTFTERASVFDQLCVWANVFAPNAAKFFYVKRNWCLFFDFTKNLTGLFCFIIQNSSLKTNTFYACTFFTSVKTRFVSILIKI